MTHRFFATSALGRAFFEDELDHDLVRALLLDDDAAANVSTLVRLEFLATCATLARGGRIGSATHYVSRLDALLADGSVSMVDITLAEILAPGEDLIRRHGLRTLDALHVATALQLAVDETAVFVTRDAAQARAARAEGLAVE